MNVAKVSQYLLKTGQPKFRVNQVLENYYLAKFNSFEEMTNISKDLRFKLSENFSFLSVKENDMVESKNSLKAKLKLADKLDIETVLLKYKDWNTVCVSTQVGCAMGCRFCATGSMGFKRNLTTEEIVDQIIYWKQKGIDTSRIVFMGMGEPFMNWQNVKQSLIEINRNLKIGWRKMTVSTVGIIEGIEEFISWGQQVNLAISLHSLNQEIREKIMPATKVYKLNELIKSCHKYTNQSKRLLFFEYALMDGINDTDTDAHKLADLVNSNKLFFANIIKLNMVKTSKIKPSKRVDQFCRILDVNRVKYSRRMSMGGEIKGACGQLVV